MNARCSEVPEFTGVSAPYEHPLQPDLVIHTDRETIEESVAQLVGYIEKRFR